MAVILDPESLSLDIAGLGDTPGLGLGVGGEEVFPSTHIGIERYGIPRPPPSEIPDKLYVPEGTYVVGPSPTAMVNVGRAIEPLNG